MVFLLLILYLVLFMSFCSFQKNLNLNRFGFKKMIAGSYDSIISEYRLTRVKMTAKIFQDYPVFGIGFNHFRLRFNEYCSKADKIESYEFKIPDNMYLALLAETGLVGITGFLVFIFYLFKSGIGRFSKLTDQSDKTVLLVTLSALAGLLVNMGAYELFYWNNPYMLFCLICGFIQSACRTPGRQL